MRYKGEPPIIGKCTRLASVQDLDRTNALNFNAQNNQLPISANGELGIKLEGDSTNQKVFKPRIKINPLVKVINYFKNLF